VLNTHEKGIKRAVVCVIYVKNVKGDLLLSIILKKAGHIIGQCVITVLKATRPLVPLGQVVDIKRKPHVIDAALREKT
jgi:hypothetical protein